jgi:hypothetical protein
MNKKLGTVVALAATLTLSLLAPMAHADDQGNKNTWRNIGIGSAVIAGHGLLTHNRTEAIIGVAGAAYSAHRYEEARHNQSVNRQRYYYRHHHRHYYN